MNSRVGLTLLMTLLLPGVTAASGVEVRCSKRYSPPVWEECPSPWELNLGAASLPLGLSGTAGSVVVTSDSATGEFSLNDLPDEEWGPSVQVNLPPDGGVSRRIFFRDNRPGSHTLRASVDGGVVLEWSAEVRPDVLQDDFESGGVLRSDVRPGQWSRRQIRAPNSLEVSPLAAHRGDGGLRVVDADATPGEARVEAAASLHLKPITTDLFVRMWMRATDVTPGEMTFFTATTIQSGPLMGELKITNPRLLTLAGNSGPGEISERDVTTIDLSDGEWHLLEMGVMGVGSAAGNRILWRDGVEVLRQTPNFAEPPNQWVTRRIGIGGTWSVNPFLTATLDFDDVRVSTYPPPSRVSVSASEALLRGGCEPLEVVLRASLDALPAEAPYDIQVALEPAGGALFTDSECTSASSEVRVQEGFSSERVYLRPDATEITVSVRHVEGDLLEGTAAFTSAELIARVDPSELEVMKGESITLNASGSRAAPGREISAFIWTPLEGPAHVPLESTATPTFVAPEPGRYVYELVITDGEVRSERVQVTVAVEGERDHPPREIGGCYCSSGNGSLVVLGIFFGLLTRRRKPSGSE